MVCMAGGSLICCDLCPTSFHASCLNISTPPDGSYICEDCLTGRFPLYGEIVWVKLGVYRWWPAEILYPALIPDNILNLPHVRGEFAVKFFGSHDHYWINRGRVFLYQDGDTAGKSNYKKSSVDNMFEKAVKEASEAQQKYAEEKTTREAGTRPGMKPPNYVKLKTNKPVGNVRMLEMNISSLTPCECDPNSKAPCAPESDCLNRILMVECNPQVCPAGEKCCNQLFEKRQYPPLQPYQTQSRGWGLRTLVDLKKGDFVIEYVGEMIDEEEYKKRLSHMHENNEENFYFLTIDKDRMLDAGPKGNVARFMNHSCQPNCETQKWTVNGDTRVGLFALCDIPANSELVFNYNLESIGSDKKPCMCGAPNCSGFIGVKANKNADKEDNKEKKTTKKKKVVVSKTHEEECFVCGEEGELLLCDGKHCTKGYHLSCLGKKQHPQGYWLCPWHQCNICNKGRVRRCTFCVNSFCQEHSEGNIRLDPMKGLVCLKHDEEKTVENNKSETGVDSLKPKPDSTTEPITVETNIIDSSDNLTTSSQNHTESSVKEDPTNNNIVIKSIDVPKRRSRRARSYAENNKPNSDKVVNGLVGKVSKRKNRPSSVDDKLIVSYEKTEHNGELSPKSNKTDDEVNASNDVTELLHQVITNLPIENIDSADNDDTQSEIHSENKNGKHGQKHNEFDQLHNISDVSSMQDLICETESDSVNCNKRKLVDSLDTTNQNDLDNQPESIKDVDDNECHQKGDIVNSTVKGEIKNFEEDQKIEGHTETSNNLDSEKLSVEESYDSEKMIVDDIEEVVNKVSESTTGNKEETLVSRNNEHVEENVDDFELSYSESSSDKVYKSESSLEMKLTDFNTSEKKRTNEKLEGLNGKSELSNCIEQSNNIMEVA
ncbi:Histone-lysine N-methyltransferase, H3 lysine-36 and H4 lysine-20 specific [Homalodisca vitripennis]|nr:Histone-lysine N-methyltransferase, H3 lysine-36 and H4 lysine-20 specific [Homalodisca vitripennis]